MEHGSQLWTTLNSSVRDCEHVTKDAVQAESALHLLFERSQHQRGTGETFSLFSYKSDESFITERSCAQDRGFGVQSTGYSGEAGVSSGFHGVTFLDKN